MIRVEAAEVPGARLVAGDGGAAIDRVAIDSRQAGPGALFVALRGEHADGHDFIDAAVAAGAAAVLGESGRVGSRGSVAALEADAPLAVVQALGRQVRRRSAANVLGIAGSAGKTSTKDVLRALVAPHAPIVATHRNNNNELGVPLTLCRIEPDTRVCVCEMAMRAPGEIAELCAIAEPSSGLITAIGPEHLEFLGTVEAVARTQAELLVSLPPGADAILPVDEPLLDPHRRGDLLSTTFGDSPEADVRTLAFVADGSGTAVELDVLGERVSFWTNLRADHHRLNLAAAVAAYVRLGLPLAGVGEGAATIALSPWRGQERALQGGGLLINDAYNANPSSMRAALASLVARADGARSVAVLGEMAELGTGAGEWHRAVGAAAAAAGVDVLVAVGEPALGYVDGAGAGIETHAFGDVDAAAAALPALLRDGDVVLVKASRAAGLERLEGAIA